MLPRVPNAASASRAPARRWTPCKFVSGGDVAHYLAQEVVIEGVLHVSAAQAGTCLERFGDIDALPAPALPPLEDVLAAPTGAPGPAATTTTTTTHSASSAAPVQTVHSGSTPFAVTAGALGGSSSSSPLHGGPAGLQRPSAQAASRASSATERIVSEAFCLATPPDNPGENNSPLRQPQPQPARAAGGASAQTATSTPRGGNSSSSSSFLRLQALRGSPSSSNTTNSGGSSGSSLPAELEEFLQLEGTAAAYQYGAARMSAQALHANEVLRASAAVRRQRRRALIRLLRRTREKSAAGLSVLQDSTPVQLLATIGASISSLGSWDDEGPSWPGNSAGSKRRSSCSACSSGSDTDVEWDSSAAADSSMDE